MPDSTSQKAGDISITTNNIELGTMNDQSSSPLFNKLPAELRLKIYRCCLFVGKVAPYSNSEAKPLLPFVPVLRVCKAIFLEAEPVVYENTFILAYHTAIQELFDKTLATPARKLMLRSVEISLENKYPIPEDMLSFAMRDLSQRINTHRTGYFDLKLLCLLKNMERDIAWPRKVDPILENLTLDRIVLDLSYSPCSGGCNCNMAAVAITYFDRGFALRSPNSVEIKGWDAGREDVEVMVHDCLELWTSKRMIGCPDSVRSAKFEAEEWLLEKVARELVKKRW